jgi:hypothetical protein
MKILLILLGSHISYLLKNRIETAINFVGSFNDTNVDWFLSGGIKNSGQDSITEAEKMAQQISKFEKIYTNELRGNTWNYIYDTQATNTAENFIMVRNYLNKLHEVYDEVYVITSDFHQNRANKIAEKILDVYPKWILGNAKLDDSHYWERIHIRNVDADVNKALKKFDIS